jgi:hypothetical protein
MDRTTPFELEESIGIPSGRLKWTRDGDDLVSGLYRIRLRAPERWETRYQGRVLRVDTRRSYAFAGAEHHYRETERMRQIITRGALAGVALVGAIVSAHWISTLPGFLVFVAAVCLFLGSAVRCGAAITKNLLDPYRIREPWESRDRY